MRFDSITLKDAIEYVQDLSGANINVNWKALEAAGVDKSAVVSLHLRDISLRKGLNVILAQASGQNDLLTFYIADNVIEITTRELADKVMITRVYPIDDLIVDVPDFDTIPDISANSNSSGGRGGNGGGSGTGGGSSSLFGSNTNTNSEKSVSKTDKAQQIIDLITAVIRPDIWQVNGGAATIRYFNKSLIVTAPRSVQDEISGAVD